MFSFNIKRVVYFFLLTLIGNLQAEQYIIEIGNKKYSTVDIQTIMNDNRFVLPDQAIQKLQQDEIIKSLKSSKDFLYEKFFGVSFKMDNARMKALDLPDLSKKAGCRNYMFEVWLNEKARKVSVKYLDITGFWEMVKQTESYQIREQVGVKMSSDEILYTAAELALPENQRIATKDKKLVLSGKEYNDYIRDNYNQVSPFASRKKDIHSVQNYLIERIVGERVAVDNLPNAENFDEIQLEREIRGFIQSNMLSEELNFKGKEYMSPSDMLEDLHVAYKAKNANKLNSLKDAITGKVNIDSLETDMKLYVLQRKLERLKKNITKQISSSEVYTWMEENKFSAGFNDALFVMTNDKYQKQITTTLKESGIQLHLLEE
ncbi:MAG: hypothetical protein JXA91_03315 [Candidatus Thermoplasmatota archaeon]|nr:hypothetical protein [Candidatus Thermoplasmatota archaeon]